MHPDVPTDEPKIQEASIYAALGEIFADVFGRDDIALAPGLEAKDVAGWDSFRQIEIIVATERCFGFKFASAEIDGMRTLGDLVAIVARRQSDDPLARAGGSRNQSTTTLAPSVTRE